MNEKLIYIVRTNLRSRGYRVKTLSRTALGFDLLVGGIHRVIVLPYKKGEEKQGHDQGRNVIAALVSFDVANRPVIVYVKSWEDQPTPRPQDVFGLSASKVKYVEGKKGKAAAKKGGKKA